MNEPTLPAGEQMLLARTRLGGELMPRLPLTDPHLRLFALAADNWRCFRGESV